MFRHCKLAGDRSPMSVLNRNQREDIANAYAACLAAGREEAAEETANIMRIVSDDWLADRAHLVKHAGRANELRPQHLAWLEEAIAKGVEVDPALLEAAREIANEATE